LRGDPRFNIAAIDGSFLLEFYGRPAATFISETHHEGSAGEKEKNTETGPL
jgi:hypothetical protein